jgi:FixJ family two-component response regulator
VLVEDDAAMRAAIDRSLSGAGPVVRGFASAEALVQFLQGGPLWSSVRCVVSDVRLPGACGFELQRQVAAHAPAPRWIFITAHDDPALRRAAERAHAGYLAKPFAGRALLHLVEQVIAQPLPQGATFTTPKAN